MSGADFVPVESESAAASKQRTKNPLPHKWLKSSWVEGASVSIRPDGEEVITTNAVDRADLYLWAKRNQFPFLTMRQYRTALRRMCVGNGGGSKVSMQLRADVRVMLAIYIDKLGRGSWGCSLLESVTTDYDPGLDAAIQIVLDRPSRKQFKASTNEAKGSSRNPVVCNSMAQVQFPGQSSSALYSLVRNKFSPVHNPRYPNNTFASPEQKAQSWAPPIQHRATMPLVYPRDKASQDSPIQGSLWDYCSQALQDNAPLVPYNQQQQYYKRQLQQQQQEQEQPQQQRQQPEPQIQHPQPQTQTQQQENQQRGDSSEDDNDDEETLEGSLWKYYSHALCDSPGLPESHKRSKLMQPSSSSSSSPSNVELLQPGVFVSSTDLGSGSYGPLVSRQISDSQSSSELEAEVVALTNLFVHVGVMPSHNFAAWEHHVTSCFSHPELMCFVVGNLARNTTKEPLMYQNQTATNFVNVDMTRQFHQTVEVDTMRRGREAMQASNRNEGELVMVPEIWVNGFTKHGEPKRILMDAWISCELFSNGVTSFLAAPQGSVSLIRQPGFYRGEGLRL